LGMFLQIFTALFGGVIIAKLGRNRATVGFALLSGSVPCLLWSLAGNFWHFLIAALFACFAPISSNAIVSLLVEDCPPEKLVSTYALWSATGYIAAFFAPISMLMVDHMGVVPTMRILYFTMFVMITVKFISFYFLCKETKTGRRRMQETKGVPLVSALGGYRAVLGELLHSPQVRVTLALSV
ncbi:MAG: MFS transporter, partial [Angelakisella sp.]